MLNNFVEMSAKLLTDDVRLFWFDSIKSLKLPALMMGNTPRIFMSSVVSPQKEAFSSARTLLLISISKRVKNVRIMLASDVGWNQSRFSIYQ